MSSYDPIDGNAVAYRVMDGHRTEIARWEYGSYETGVRAPGARFTLFDFAKALSGKSDADLHPSERDPDQPPASAAPSTIRRIGKPPG